MQTQSIYARFAFNPYVSNRGMMVGSAMGLAVIAIWYDVSESERTELQATLAFADVLVTKCLDDLVAPDGAYREGVLYGAWTMRMCLPYVEARRRFDGVDLAAGRPIAAMAEWLAYEVLPEGGGRTNNLNDSPWFSTPLAAHSTVLDWAQMRSRSPVARWVYRHVAGEFGAAEPEVADRTATVLWSRTIPNLDPGTLLPPSRLFAGRGLFVHRSGWKSGATGSELHFTFYAGPFAGGHAQEDQGQFTLYAHGDRFALDSGSAYPTAGPKETESHNLILIDGRGQHNAGNSIGTDAWIASAHLSSFCDYLRADLATAYTTHSPFNDPDVPFPGTDWTWGYDGGNPVQRADRMVAVVHGPEAPTWLWIADDIRKDEAPHLYEWLLHTDTANTVDLQSEPVTVRGAQSRLAIRFAHPPPAALDLSCAPYANGGEDPSTLRLVARTQAVEPRFVVALLPLATTTAMPLTSVVQLAGATALVLDWSGVQDIAIANASGALVDGPVTTDGKMAVVRTSAGQVVHWMLAEGRFLAHGGIERLTMEPPGSATLSGSTLQFDRIPGLFTAYAPGVTTVCGPQGIPISFVREGPWVRSLSIAKRLGRPRDQQVRKADRLEIDIDCAPATGARLQVTIHDVRGRLVRSLNGPRDSGRGAVLEWDGMNERGGRVAAGIYFARVLGCERRDTRRLLVIR